MKLTRTSVAIAAPAAALALAACGASPHPSHDVAAAPSPTATGHVPPDTPPQASVFHVTSATVTYVTGAQVPGDVKETSNDQFPGTARVAKINYAYRNDGQQPLEAAPEKVYDTLGREYTGHAPQLTLQDNGTVAPGLQGRGTAYIVVAPTTHVASIGLEAWDSTGVINPAFGYVQRHTTGG